MNKRAFLHRLQAMGISEAGRRAYLRLAGNWISSRIERQAELHSGAELISPLLEKPIQVEPESADDVPVLNESLVVAQQALAGKVTVFGRKVNIGDNPDWLIDPAGGGSAGDLEKLPAWSENFTATGLDIRSIWELNRLQVLVDLGRAWRLTGREEFAELAAKWLTSWNEQNPFARSVNWTSGLEVALRAVSILVAVNSLRDAPVIQDDAFRSMLSRLFFLHGEYVATHTSPPSSGFNHLAGEAAALALLGEMLPGMAPAAGWRIEGLALLRQCVHRLILPGGGGLEGSLHYTGFVCRLAAVTAMLYRRDVQDVMGREGADRLRAAYIFLSEMTDGGGALSEYGDSDEAWLPGTPPSGHRQHYCGTLNLLWLLGGSNELLHDFEPCQDSYWLYGREPVSQRLETAERKEPGALATFSDSGHHAARPFPGSFVRFECGHWGDGVTWSHSHADRLSFSFYLDSEPVFTDPGTGFYLQDQAMRDYLRSTRAHTTATIDGLSQGTPLSTFFWEKEIGSSLLDSVATDCEIMLEGILENGLPTADGKKVLHHRRLRLFRQEPKMVVEDMFQAEGGHRVDITFNLHPTCQVSAGSDSSREATIRSAQGAEILLTADRGCTVSLHRGEREPLRGWYSRKFGTVEPCWQVVVSRDINGNGWINTELVVKRRKTG